jgi:hypothetical protein
VAAAAGLARGGGEVILPVGWPGRSPCPAGRGRWSCSPGAGSGRFSPRNRRVAAWLRQAEQHRERMASRRLRLPPPPALVSLGDGHVGEVDAFMDDLRKLGGVVAPKEIRGSGHRRALPIVVDLSAGEEDREHAHGQGPDGPDRCDDACGSLERRGVLNGPDNQEGARGKADHKARLPRRESLGEGNPASSGENPNVGWRTRPLTRRQSCGDLRVGARVARRVDEVPKRGVRRERTLSFDLGYPRGRETASSGPSCGAALRTSDRRGASLDSLAHP